MIQSSDSVLGAPARLAALRRLALVDTPAEPAFDRLTRLTAALLTAPIALIALAEADRLFYKSSFGLAEPAADTLEVHPTPLFCRHIVASGTLLVVVDARERPLLRPDLALGDLAGIAYLGMPLTTPGGHVLGCLCVIDPQPRQWQPDQIMLLQDLAALVMTEIELRSEALQRREDVAALTFQAHIIDGVQDAVIGTDGQFRIRLWNGAAVTFFGWQAEEVLGKFVHEVIPVQRYLGGGTVQEAIRLLQAQGVWKGDVVQQHRDGHEVLVEASVQILYDELGVPSGVVTISRDIAARLETEQQLRESAERLSFVLESAQIGYWDLDLIGNTTARSLLHDQAFGYSDLQPQWSYEIFLAHVHSPDRERVDQCFRDALTGRGHYNVEFRVVWPDQSQHWLLSIGRLIHTPAGHGDRLAGVVLDITSRKQPQEALLELSRQSERQAHIFNTVLSFTSDFAYIFDREGRFVYANQALLALWDLPLDEVIGKDFFGLPYPEELASGLQRQVQQVLDTKQSLIGETAYTGPTGAGGYFEYIFRPVLAADGTVDQVVGSSRDITARKGAEEALRASEARYRTLIDHFPNGAVFLFDRDLRYIVAGGIGLALVGLSPQLVVGKTLWDLFPPDIVARDEPVMRAALRGVATRVEVPFGEYIFVMHTLPITDDRAEIVGGLIMTQDISEQKRAEEARLGRESAEQASRAKSEFLSRMSHELRTPLNAILGFAQLLEMDGLAPISQESVDQILRGGRHLLTLINDVLDITRVESGDLALTLEPIRVGDLVQEAITLIGPITAQYQVQIDAVPDRDCQRYVMADCSQLKQVLLNLLANGVKYNHKGGRVWVKCSVAADNRLRLEFHDTGSGISAAHLPRLFTPFESLDAVHTTIEGTGLGLALSKRLVEAMGGSIGVESVVGKGSTFWIELPLAAPTEGMGEAAVGMVSGSTELLAPGAATRKLLYIEDNLSNLRLIERVLMRRSEIALLSALQGHIGLELARQQQPDLILLDKHLPDMQGDEVLRRLRADPATHSIPVIMLSADANPQRRAEMLAAGASAYLTKPLDVLHFLAVIDETLATIALRGRLA